MKKLVLLGILTLMLTAQDNGERFFEDKNAHANGFGLHADVGYSSYLIELDSSEINSAIDYDMLEFTLGTTYSYEDWMLGIYAKFLLKELKSNMFVVTTQEKLADQANIDKEEFGVYVNHTLKQEVDETWSLNFIYRYATLEAQDSYKNFNTYATVFDYKTEGLALSLVYAKVLSDETSWFAQAGLVYSEASVKMSEFINAQSQDSFVDDDTRALGGKLSMGYTQAINKNLFLTVRADAWRLNFSKLKVDSQVGDVLPKASLREESYSTYMGMTWRF